MLLTEYPVSLGQLAWGVHSISEQASCFPWFHHLLGGGSLTPGLHVVSQASGTVNCPETPSARACLVWAQFPPNQSLASLGWMHLTLTIAHLGVQLGSGAVGNWATLPVCAAHLSSGGEVFPLQEKKITEAGSH